MKIIVLKPLIFFILVSIMLITQSFIYERTSNRTDINKKLLIGKWVYKYPKIGKIIIVFNNDNTGYTLFNSDKPGYRFKYSFKNDSTLKLVSGKYPPEYHTIRLLNDKKLELRAFPFKEIRENINLIDAEFKRINK